MFYRKFMAAGGFAALRLSQPSAIPGRAGTAAPGPAATHPGAAPVPLDQARVLVARNLERRHPHWRIWWSDRWHARRRGDWLALADGGAYYLTAPGRHELSVLLSLEDRREPRGAWKR